MKISGEITIIIGFAIIITVSKSNGLATDVTNTTKKCDEGWQGNNCEFCAGKIRLNFLLYRNLTENGTFSWK